MGNYNSTTFKNYLTAKSAVNKKYVDYYVRWVSSCHGFLNVPPSEVLVPEQKNNSFIISKRDMRHGR